MNNNDKAKVLVLDIETMPMEVYVWDIKDQYISHSQIKQDWTIGAWSAKWLGDPARKMFYADTSGQADVRDDKSIMLKLKKLLEQADFIMTQNGKRFDWPKIKARFILNNIAPPKFFKHIDVYQELKHIGFTSHSLEYITKKLNKKYQKLSHKKFPGLSLWIECLKRNKEAWAEMKLYNGYDVLATEEMFEMTKQWQPKTVYQIHSPKQGCPTCGGKNYGSAGIRAKDGVQYRRLFCKSCGKHLPVDLAVKIAQEVKK